MELVMKTMRRPIEKLSKKNKQAMYGYLFASLWIIGFLTFIVIPLGSSIYYSFTSYDTLSEPVFIGFNNYITLFKDPIFWKSLGNTLFHVLISTPFSIILGICVALILNKPVKGLGMWRLFFYLPNIVSSIAMALLWVWLFNKDYGMINQFIGFFGFGKVDWLGSASVVKISLILMGAWGSGITALFFLGALKSIPKELYEAAQIAGVSKFKQFYTITLPLITPTIFFMLVTGVIASFQMFMLAYVMTGKGPENAAYYLAYYLYDMGIVSKQMGYASAMSWMMFIVVMVFVVIIFKSQKKWVYYMGSNT